MSRREGVEENSSSERDWSDELPWGFYQPGMPSSDSRRVRGNLAARISRARNSDTLGVNVRKPPLMLDSLGSMMFESPRILGTSRACNDHSPRHYALEEVNVA